MDYKKEIARLVADKAGMDAGELESFLETPPQPEMGDYALPCFIYKQNRKCRRLSQLLY